MNKEDLVLGKQYSLWRYGANKYDTPPTVELIDLASGPSQSYLRVKILNAGSSGWRQGFSINTTAGELREIPVVQETIVTKPVVFYNPDDLALASKYYESFSKAVQSDDAVVEFSATVIAVDAEYIIAKFRFEDGILVCDLTEHGATYEV